MAKVKADGIEIEVPGDRTLGAPRKAAAWPIQGVIRHFRLERGRRIPQRRGRTPGAAE